MSGLLLVGAGPGLGRSIARRFARDGMPVALLARSKATLASVAADLADLGVPVSTYQADAGRTDELEAALRATIGDNGVPDVAVYNAGLIQADGPGDLTAEEQLHAWSVNVLGACR
jgi:short-subunit dehydrogenase